MFLFRLAGHLGRTVAEIEEMSHPELMEWVAFSRIEPIGDARLDYLFALLMQTMASCWSSSKHKLQDFLPDWLGERSQGMDPAGVLTALKGMAKKESI